MSTYSATLSWDWIANDADFRLALSDYMLALAGAGLVQTADTGQVDAGTTTSPAFDDFSRYQIWRFNDSLQSVAPIFVRFEFSQNLQVRIRVGVATDGAGNLIGLSTTPTISGNNASTATAVRACRNEGFSGLMWRVPGADNVAPYGSFAICRSCDSGGIPTADACYVLLASDAGAVAQVISFIEGEVIPAAPSSSISHFPLGLVRAIDGSTPFYPLWMPIPHLVPVFGLAVVPNALVSGYDQADLTLVGAVTRRYLVFKSAFQHQSAPTCIAMLWE